VDGVSLGVPRGELRSIIGPNGAGKTTLFNVLTGLLPADRGHARFRSTAITGRLPHAIVAAGVSRSFQIISIFHALTVFENVRIAAQAKHGCRFAMLADAGSFADLNAEALELLRAVGLGDRAFEIAATLSHGDQRLLAPEGTTRGARRPAAPLLRVTSVNTFYGKSHVLHGVSLDVFPGEFVALLGRNGAGKTTTLATITGVVPPRDGRIAYRAADVAGRPPEEIARRGIGLVPQGRRIFPNLTVLENLTIARR